MESNETTKKKRVYKLKFDQLWKDAIAQMPVYYHSEIYELIDYYQRNDCPIGTIKDDLVRTVFMLIYPTIRRRRLARERQRRYRARKKAAKLAALAAMEAQQQQVLADNPESRLPTANAVPCRQQFHCTEKSPRRASRKAIKWRRPSHVG